MGYGDYDNPTRKGDYLLKQRDYKSYQTLQDANDGLLFKTPGIEVYIITEDKFYYWNGTTWVDEGIGSSGLSVSSITYTTVVGVNTIPHNITGTIYGVETFNASNNDKITFGNLVWNGTNIVFNSSRILNIKINIFYKN